MGLVDSGLGVERELGVNLGRNSTGDDLQDLSTELNEKSVHGVLGLDFNVTDQERKMLNVDPKMSRYKGMTYPPLDLAYWIAGSMSLAYAGILVAARLQGYSILASAVH